VRVRLLILLSLTGLLPAAPAFAHAGGRAQLYVATATVTPRGGGWSISTVLRDLDSGAPEPGFGVEVSGAGPSGAAFGTVALADPEGDGRYEAALPAIAAGNWALTVRASEVPGGNAALPVEKTWNVALRPGQPVDLARAGSSGGAKGSGTNLMTLALAIGGAAGLCVAAGAWFGRHRRARVPVR
jgi:hypothetical protein